MVNSDLYELKLRCLVAKVAVIRGSEGVSGAVKNNGVSIVQQAERFFVLD
jgi:hypothetical protein